MNNDETKEEPVEIPANPQLGNAVLFGFFILLLLGFACYYFGIELNDLT